MVLAVTLPPWISTLGGLFTFNRADAELDSLRIGAANATPDAFSFRSAKGVNPGAPYGQDAVAGLQLARHNPSMSHDTTEINRTRFSVEDRDSVWLFGYGSLIFKADFDYLEARPASIEGWARRFWQGSHDHRGTPEAPGRVTTLVEEPGARCVGMAYRVSPEVFEHLDVREKNGYLRFMTPMTFNDGSHAEGLVYIATEDNAAWLGPAPEAEIAAHIHRSRGPSGENREYLVRLAEALRALRVHDEHVFGIEACLPEAG